MNMVRARGRRERTGRPTDGDDLRRESEPLLSGHDRSAREDRQPPAQLARLNSNLVF